MQLVYSVHARERMEERAITEEEIVAVITNPTRQSISRTGNLLYSGRVNGRELTVVIGRGSNPTAVVTVWD